MTRGRSLPQRYDQPWGTEFWGFVSRALETGTTVLDVGAGRRPTILPEERPPGMRYVGLDAGGGELIAAPPGSYDEMIVTDVQTRLPELLDRFDVVLAWQVLEHVRDLRRAADVLLEYTNPGGWFVSCLSGRHAAFALANRILPDWIGSRVVARLRQRPAETVFPAFYDRCDPRGLRVAFAKWDSVEIVPLWHAADYFDRIPKVQSLYLRYEDWAVRRNLDSLATHYVVAARKAPAE